jgi:hypothetical protein
MKNSQSQHQSCAIVVSALVVVAMAVGVHAFSPRLVRQSGVPSFAGVWQPETDSTSVIAGGRGGLGAVITVRQSPTELSVERQGRGGTMKSTYKLDGSESDVSDIGGRAKARTKWLGTVLEISTTREIGRQVQRWSVDGDKLIVTLLTPEKPVVRTYRRIASIDQSPR